jgi:hypothetical protein
VTRKLKRPDERIHSKFSSSSYATQFFCYMRYNVRLLNYLVACYCLLHHYPAHADWLKMAFRDVGLKEGKNVVVFGSAKDCLAWV